MNIVYLLVTCYGFDTANIICQPLVDFGEPIACIKAAKKADDNDTPHLWMCIARDKNDDWKGNKNDINEGD